MSRPRHPRVLSVGPDPHGRGGMVAVTRLMMRHCDAVADLEVIRTHVDGSAGERLRAWLGGSARVVHRLATGRVDVLHLHVSRRGSILRKVLLTVPARLLRVPFVLHCHAGQFADEFRSMPRPLQRLIAVAFRRADHLVVLGSRWKSEYVELVGIEPSRVSVATNPVALPEHVPQRPVSPVTLVYLGRYEHGKGTYDLLRAVAALAPPLRSGIRLMMAGDGEVDRARGLVDELGLTDIVTVRGWVDPTERDAMLATASVFVLPSYHEGLPMAMLEAMAWGVVPVVSPVGSIPEIVVDGHNGLIVEPGDVSSIGGALRRLITDPQLRARLAQGARRTAADHGVEPFVDRLAQVWRAAADREDLSSTS